MVEYQTCDHPVTLKGALIKEKSWFADAKAALLELESSPPAQLVSGGHGTQ